MYRVGELVLKTAFRELYFADTQVQRHEPHDVVQRGMQTQIM